MDVGLTVGKKLYLGLCDRITKNAFCTGNDSWVLSINNLSTVFCS